jgi:hypothetical protein
MGCCVLLAEPRVADGGGISHANDTPRLTALATGMCGAGPSA